MLSTKSYLEVNVMDDNLYENVHRINCLANELDSIYHQAALRLGISDSVMFVLYMLHDKGDGCLLYDICNETGISKQTINSAIRRLEQDGIIFLEHYKGKSKQVFLTEKGKEYVAQTVARLYEAECRVFDGWSKEEITMHFNLLKKYNDALREEIKDI